MADADRLKDPPSPSATGRRLHHANEEEAGAGAATEARRLRAVFAPLRDRDDALVSVLRCLPPTEHRHAYLALFQVLGGPYFDAGTRAAALCERAFGDRAAVPQSAPARGEDPAHSPRSTAPSGLPAPVQARMEAFFGHDFSDVRVRTDSPLPGEVEAAAFTDGRDIHIAPGEPGPGTVDGDRLVGHELAHVVQQRQGRVAPTFRQGDRDVNDDPTLEAEADELGARASRFQLDASRAPPPFVLAAAPPAHAPLQLHRGVVQRTPGRAHRSGWKYGGDGSRAWTEQTVERARDWYEANRYPDLAVAATTFRRTINREGSISAINTWDGLLLTWGVGFAGSVINSDLWPLLPESVKRALIDAVPSRFRASGVVIDEGVRLHHPTLEALVRVSENEPHRSAVMKAQFLGFCRGTMGMAVGTDTPFLDGAGTGSYAQGQAAEFPDPGMVYWSSRLAHYLRIWDHPAYAREALALTGPSPSLTAFLSATIHLLTRKAMEAGYVQPVGSRYKLARGTHRTAPWVSSYISRFQNRLTESLIEDVPGRAFTITPQVSSLTPAFSAPRFPFLVGHRSLDEIPEGHMYAEQRALSDRQVESANALLDEVAGETRFTSMDRVRRLCRRAGLGSQMSTRGGANEYYDLGPYYGSATDPRYARWAALQPTYGEMPPELEEADPETFDAIIAELARTPPPDPSEGGGTPSE